MRNKRNLRKNGKSPEFVVEKRDSVLESEGWKLTSIRSSSLVSERKGMQLKICLGIETKLSIQFPYVVSRQSPPSYSPS